MDFEALLKDLKKNNFRFVWGKMGRFKERI